MQLQHQGGMFVCALAVAIETVGKEAACSKSGLGQLGMLQEGAPVWADGPPCGSLVESRTAC